jgi:hypothetical protein
MGYNGGIRAKEYEVWRVRGKCFPQLEKMRARARSARTTYINNYPKSKPGSRSSIPFF